MHEIHLRLISLPNWHYPFLPCLHLVLCLLLVPFHQLVLREFRQSQILQKRKKMKKKYRSTWGSVMESLFVRRSLLLVWTVNKIILFWLSTCAFDKHFLLLTCLNAMWADRVKSDKPECRVQTCTIHQITWCNNMASEVTTCNRLQWTYFSASLCIQLTFGFFTGVRFMKKNGYLLRIRIRQPYNSTSVRREGFHFVDHFINAWWSPFCLYYWWQFGRNHVINLTFRYDHHISL